MRFLPAFALCLLAAACSSTSSALVTPANTPQTVTVSGGSGLGNISFTQMKDATDALTFALNAPVEDVWAALPVVYSMLEVEAGVVNEGGRLFGNPNLRVRGRLAGERPSQFVNCGKNPIGVPIATNEPLQLSIMTGLSPASDGVTRVVVRVQGTATSGATSARSSCGSTGELEQRIHKLLLAQLSA